MPNSSEKNAACGPYIRPCPRLTPTAIESQISTGDSVLISPNSGNAHSVVITAPARYSGLRPTRSDSAPHSGTVTRPMAAAMITPHSIVPLARPSSSSP